MRKSHASQYANFGWLHLFSKTKFNDVKEQSGLDGPNLFSNHNF